MVLIGVATFILMRQTKQLSQADPVDQTARTDQDDKPHPASQSPQQQQQHYELSSNQEDIHEL